MPDPTSASAAAATSALGGASAAGAAPGGAPGGDGAGAVAADWMARAGFSDDFRKAVAGDNYKDMGAFEHSVLGQREQIGRKGFVLPGKDAKPEEWEKVWETLGRPKDAKEYAFAAPNGGKFTDYDVAFQDHMRPYLHRAGVAGRQLDPIAEGVVAWNAAELKKYQDGQAAEMAAVQKEWAGDWDARLALGRAGAEALAKRAFGEKAAPDQVNAAIERMLGTAATLKIAHALGEMLQEPGATAGLSGNKAAIQNADQARKRIDEIRAAARRDAKHPINHPNTPEGEKANEELAALYKFLPAEDAR